MMQTIFTVDGDPQGKARPRFTRGGRAYTPKKTVEYERVIKNAFIAAGGTLTNLPVTVGINAYYKIPASATKKKAVQMMSGEIMPTKKPDTDNIAKAVCDALNGVAYHDDAQVCNLSVKKRYSKEPCIVVTIKEVIP